MKEKELSQLNAWIAEHVMGFKPTDDPDSQFDTNDRLSFSGAASKRCMVSTTYQHNKKGKWWHQWYYYEPTTDPAAAMEVLKKCYGLGVAGESIVIWNIQNGDTCIELFNYKDNDKKRVQAETLELAICLFAKKLFTK